MRRHRRVGASAKRALTQQMRAMLQQQWLAHRHVCENYSPARHAPNCTGDRFHHWGALAGLLTRMEAGELPLPIHSHTMAAAATHAAESPSASVSSASTAGPGARALDPAHSGASASATATGHSPTITSRPGYAQAAAATEAAQHEARMLESWVSFAVRHILGAFGAHGIGELDLDRPLDRPPQATEL